MFFFHILFLSINVIFLKIKMLVSNICAIKQLYLRQIFIALEVQETLLLLY